MTKQLIFEQYHKNGYAHFRDTAHSIHSSTVAQERLMTSMCLQLPSPEEGSGLAAQADAFEQNVLGVQDRAAWGQYCQHKADTAAKNTDKETWTWLHILFEDDASRQAMRPHSCMILLATWVPQGPAGPQFH